jgi:shikimate kinase
VPKKMPGTNGCRNNIIFIGMPGSGKSTIGRIVAKDLKLCFYDIDRYIEQTVGKTIPEIFLKGEPYFREVEHNAVVKISQLSPCVIATGGGVVKISKNMKILRESGIVIFLNRPVEKIIETIDLESRPLLKNNIKNINNLYEERYALYKKYCDYEIANDKDMNLVIQNIMELVIT